MRTLADVEHLLFLIAEDVPISDLDVLPERVTICRAYHRTPAGEDRVARMWPAYAVALRDAGHTVHLRASVPDTLGDVTVIEATRSTVESVLADRGTLPSATLVAIALGGGSAEPIEDEYGALGEPGTLLLLSPWAGADWVSEEVCDHTSLMQLCERWTAARGREARMRLRAWRRQVCGDLVAALDLGEDVPVVTDGVTLARPVPYLPRADLRVDGDAVALLLSNAGPAAEAAAHLAVDDGTRVTRHSVPASPAGRPKVLTVPVAVRDGRYDVTVTGPNHFRRRYAGSVADDPPTCTMEQLDDDAPVLDLELGLAGEGDVTVRVQDRRTGVAHAILLVPGTTRIVHADPWPAGDGWYDLVVTAAERPTWIREYSGHLEATGRTAIAHPELQESRP